jgi:hypothetical protein
MDRIASLAIKGRMRAALAGRIVGPNVRLGVPARRRGAVRTRSPILRQVRHPTRSRTQDDLRPPGHYGSGMGDIFAGISVSDLAGALAWLTFRDPDGNEFAFGGNPTT